MKKIRKLFGVTLLIVALLVLQLPFPEVVAASTASEFSVSGSTLVKYTGDKVNVTIPAGVDTIGTDAFQYNTTVETVTIPNEVTKIEPYAFWGCSNLQTVSLGSGLDGIDDYAFANCKRLRSLVLPNNITYIGINAFQDDLNLTDITIPYTTMRIHETAFDGCFKLVIHADAGSFADFYAQKFAERQAEMAEYEDIPAYVVPAPEQADQETAEQPVPDFNPEPEEPGTVLSSVRIVGNQAVFFMNGSAGNVYDGADASSGSEEQGESVPEEDSAYLFTSNIPKYTIVDGRIVADHAFYKSGIRELNLPETIREIGEFSYARSALESAVIPNGVQTISYGAFYHCDNLTEVSIPQTVISLEPKAFEHTAWVDDFYNSPTYVSSPIGADRDFLISGGVLVAYRGAAPDVEIPEGVRVIGAEVFAGHEEIRSVNLPSTLTVIGEAAFSGCSTLSALRMNDELVTVKDRAFEGTALSSVNLPKSYQSEGLMAWPEGCIVYLTGNEPARTHEKTAERLSNGAFRAAEGGNDGLTVQGPEGVQASLEGADRAYTLTIREVAASDEMEEAQSRVLSYLDQYALTGLRTIYDFELTDESGIPVTKLGKQALTVMFPLPEEVASKNPLVLTVDRNGQLEEIASEPVEVDGRMYLRMTTYHLSPFTIYATNRTISGDVVLTARTMLSAMAGPAGSEIAEPVAAPDPLRLWIDLLGYKLYAAAGLFAFGLVCIFWRGHR